MINGGGNNNRKNNLPQSKSQYNKNNKKPPDIKYTKSASSSVSDDLPENEYYTDIAHKFKLAKLFTVVFLILFIIASVILNPKELGADNLKYLLRYINIQGSNKSAASEFYIDLDETSSICYYKNNIAVLRKNRLDIYDMNGRTNFTSSLVYSNPVAKASDRYIITYDLGMNKMAVFNSFSMVYEYKGDTPIYYAQVTNKGNVVYVSSEKGYQSAVYVLDSGFKEKFKCSLEKDYVVGADINNEASKLAIAGFYAQNGDYLGRVILYNTNYKEPVKKIEVAGEQPYGVKLNDNGVFAVFENSFRVYDISGGEISDYDFMYRKIHAMALTPKLASVVLSEKTLGANDRILIFDSGGNILYDQIIDAQIINIKFSEDYKFLYFLTRAGLYRVNIEQKIFELAAASGEYDETTDSIVYANDRNIYLSGLLKINAVAVK